VSKLPTDGAVLYTNNLQCTNIIVSFRKPYIIVSMYGYVECLLHPGGVAKFSTHRRTSLLCLISNKTYSI
jgi:hypothetical protein